jgi:putative transposase
MPRRPRIFLPDVPQHVIQRGNNRQAIFYETVDYRVYLRGLARAAEKYSCQIHAYVLMTNHVHLLVSTGEVDGISRMMQHLGRGYVSYVNATYGRTGTLWEGRFKASLVDSQAYFLRCCLYIECNPVRAGMVNSPGDYRWSSHHANAFGGFDPLIRAHEQYLLLGHSVEERCEAYRALFQDVLGEQELNDIRCAANRGWPLGSEAFKDGIEASIDCVARPPKRGRPAKNGMGRDVTRDGSLDGKGASEMSL